MLWKQAYLESGQRRLHLKSLRQLGQNMYLTAGSIALWRLERNTGLTPRMYGGLSMGRSEKESHDGRGRGDGDGEIGGASK